MSSNTLFISVQTIKDRTGLRANVEEKLVQPEIKTAQDMYIEPLLGTALYNRLKEGIEDEDLTSDETELLDKYITDALVYYTMSELPVPLSIQFFTQGAVRKTSQNAETPSMSDLVDISTFYKKRAEYYSERLVKYLKANATAELFPEYINSGTDIDDIHPDNSGYKTSIYLGDVDRDDTCDGYYA
jgi:hypothetical protein